MGLDGLLTDGNTSYEDLEEFHEALVCADVAELIDNTELVCVLRDILFYVKNPAETQALGIVIDLLEVDRDDFYKPALTV